MKQKGFISIPILIAIIVSVIVVSAITTGVILYKQGRLKFTPSVSESITENTEIVEELKKTKQEEEISQEEKDKIAELEQRIKELEKQGVISQSSQEKKSQELQVSLTFIAQRIVSLHCFQIEGTKSHVRSLYDKSIYEPNFEGSGVIVSSTGDVLTNAHVVGIAPICLVQIAKPPNYSVPSPAYFADVVGVDYNNDLARLHINESIGEPIPSSFPFFNFVKKEVKVGDKIFIAGFSVASNKCLAITEGIISGREDISGYIPGVFLITSAKIDAGNSGGAAMTPEGNLVGLPTYLRGKYETLGYILDLLRVSIP